MQALILCGGFGNRLRTVVNDRPKPMALIHGRPFLEYIIEFIVKQNMKEITFCTGYLGHQIKDYFKDGKEWGCSITYSEEQEPLGTGGAVKLAQEVITDENFFILNGDTFLALDYGEMVASHIQNRSFLTMALSQVENVERYGSIELTQNGRIQLFTEKNQISSSNYINAGVYLCSRDILKHIAAEKRISIESEIFPKLLEEDLPLYGHKTDGYFIDIGIPETYYKFQEDLIRR